MKTGFIRKRHGKSVARFLRVARKNYYDEALTPESVEQLEEFLGAENVRIWPPYQGMASRFYSQSYFHAKKPVGEVRDRQRNWVEIRSNDLILIDKYNQVYVRDMGWVLGQYDILMMF